MKLMKTATLAAGAATLIPAAVFVLRKIARLGWLKRELPIHRDSRLIGATRFPRKGDDGFDHVELG